ncbi:putative membrane protein YqiK [Amaricoccus macauensis]|uniref:Putative membrane protein YqiK n=1 Tax=Amaricoccus macauensis TaxID=57001 RepID=A0A840SRJ8_9RHOB|nr:putative membrane protein YqiK [Amaricoccus macauensis]
MDVTCEFYVKVKASEEGVSTAAQTLGDKTFDADALREMVEGKLVDVLRAVAAQMTMDQLHENRSDFSQQVQQAAAETLLKNGLELESAALTGLDQTPFDMLDEANAFNAVGMKKLAEVIADSKRQRAQIEAETDTAVAETRLAAEKRKLELSKQEEQVRIQTSIEVETLKANEAAEVASGREEGQQRSEEPRITREQATRTAEIE